MIHRKHRYLYYYLFNSIINRHLYAQIFSLQFSTDRISHWNSSQLSREQTNLIVRYGWRLTIYFYTSTTHTDGLYVTITKYSIKIAILTIVLLQQEGSITWSSIKTRNSSTTWICIIWRYLGSSISRRWRIPLSDVYRLYKDIMVEKENEITLRNWRFRACSHYWQ